MELSSCIFLNMKLLSEFRLKTKLLIFAYKALQIHTRLLPCFKKKTYLVLSLVLLPRTSSPIVLRNSNVCVLSYLLPVSERTGEVVFVTCNAHLDSDNSHSSPCVGLLLQVPEFLNTLLGFLISAIRLSVFPSLKFLQIPGQVAMLLARTLNDIALKIQN